MMRRRLVAAAVAASSAASSSIPRRFSSFTVARFAAAASRSQSVLSVSKRFPFHAVARTFASLPAGAQELMMPALSPTMTQGNVSKWRKNVGDRVKVGDVFCEIETDKATLEFECQEEGYIAKIIVPAGTNDVQCGKVLAVLVDSPSDIPAVASYTPGGAAPAASASAPSAPAPSSTPASSAPAAPAAPAAAVSLPAGAFALKMPALSPTMTKGNLSTWKKKIGDRIKPGDVLCEIETDKATLEWESQEEGYIAAIYTPAPTADVECGSEVAIVVEKPEDIAKVSPTRPTASAAVSAPSTPSPAPSSSPVSTPAPAAPSAPLKEYNAPLSPAVRTLLDETSIDPASITPTGRGGRLTKEDVILAMEKGTAQKKSSAVAAAVAAPSKPSVSAPSVSASAPSSLTYDSIPNSNMRKVIAQRLGESKSTVPHFYMTAEARIDALMALRKQLKQMTGASISVNDFVIRASARALREVQVANSISSSSGIVQSPTVDISVAVATDKGLITPIVKNADQLGLAAISSTVKALATKAKENKLKPEEFQGGSFSISNLGMFGIDVFSAVINPPQACILAVGRGETRAVLKGKSSIVGDADSMDFEPEVQEAAELEAATYMQVTLSADRRALDESEAAQFLQSLKKYLEKPTLLVL